MDDKIIEEIEIVRWVVRVEEMPNKKQFAELVGFDKDGNEITTQTQVYVHGEYHKAETDVICTEKKQSSPSKIQSV